MKKIIITFLLFVFITTNSLAQYSFEIIDIKTNHMDNTILVSAIQSSGKTIEFSPIRLKEESIKRNNFTKTDSLKLFSIVYADFITGTVSPSFSDKSIKYKIVKPFYIKCCSVLEMPQAIRSMFK